MRERTRVLPAASSSLARAMNLLPAFPRWRDSVVRGVVNQLGERVHSQLVHQLRPVRLVLASNCPVTPLEPGTTWLAAISIAYLLS